MKTRLTAVIGIAAVSIALFFNGSAWAGAKYREEVEVSSSSANGSLTGARYGKGKKQTIGCTLAHYASSNSFQVLCSARDKDNNYLMCYDLNNVGFRKNVKAITTGSYIAFYANSTGQCTFIQVRNSSTYVK